MSTKEPKKAIAATSETNAELFDEAIRSYEKALRAGIQVQEESANLWGRSIRTVRTLAKPVSSSCVSDYHSTQRGHHRES
jgi:hypothetical protein